MTIPSDFRDQSKVVGDSAIKHPIYTFTVNLDRLKSEYVGPNTNQSNVNVLHPDMHDNSPDRGRLSSVNHQAGNISWLTSLFPGANIVINDDGTITAYGQQAVYLKKTHADVANPLLTLTNDPPYTSA